jgi:histidyl-tRNA synthetase
VLGGGRYDGLAEALGSRVPAPGIGFSIGEDRLVMTLEDRAQPARLDLLIAALGEPALRHAAVLAREPREAGITVEIVEAKLKRALEQANKLGARYVLMVGENEIAAGAYTLKNMQSGEQWSVTARELRARLAPPPTNES